MSYNIEKYFILYNIFQNFLWSTDTISISSPKELIISGECNISIESNRITFSIDIDVSVRYIYEKIYWVSRRAIYASEDHDVSIISIGNSLYDVVGVIYKFWGFFLTTLRIRIFLNDSRKSWKWNILDFFDKWIMKIFILKYENTRLHIVSSTILFEYLWLIDSMSTFVDFASLLYSRLLLNRNFQSHDYDHEFWSLN